MELRLIDETQLVGNSFSLDLPCAASDGGKVGETEICVL